jgi:hypothetical protein
MRQTEAKGRALAAAIETGARNAILGNSLLEEQISHWLLDNARLIDELLFYPAADQDLLKKISVINHLQKVELLDAQGQPWELPSAPRTRMHGQFSDQASRPHPPFKPFMWGETLAAVQA